MSAAPVTDPSPTLQVGKLPKENGKMTGKVARQDGHFNFSGTIATLTGAVGMATIEQDLLGPTANLEISVEQGKIRAYLRDSQGYRYIEATPGNPARTRGDLVYSGGTWWWTLEAVDGEARGVTYHCWRSK